MNGGDSWRLGVSWVLARSVQPASEIVNFRYDPSNPVPSLGGEISGTGDDHKDGAFDQREIETRDDVIVFTSPPMSEALDLFGLAEIGLSVSSDCPDIDFTVKIVDVYPNGRAFNIGDTIARMRYREGLDKSVFMLPSEIYDLDLPPILLSRTIEKGHRLRVEISSSNFPTYARNLNTDQNSYTSTETAIATNSIHVGGEHKSYISLPVVKSMKQ